MLVCNTLSALTLLSLICAIAALPWENVNPADLDKIIKCIQHSKRLDYDQMKKPTIRLRPTITPVAQLVVDSTIGSRIVVCMHWVGGKTSHFFAAMILSDETQLVTRLGGLWATLKGGKLHESEKEASCEAEFYYDWSPYAIGEMWQPADPVDSQINIKCNGTPYHLVWLWSLPYGNMVGIYASRPEGDEDLPAYLFCMGKELNTTEPRSVYTSQPGTLADIEEGVGRALKGVHPFLDPNWLTENELRENETILEKIQSLSKLAATQSKVIQGEVTLERAKIVSSSCESLAAVFYSKDPSILKSPIMAAGVVVDGQMQLTLHVKCGLGWSQEQLNQLLTNYYATSFSPHLLAEGGGWSGSWTWAWNYAAKYNRSLPFEPLYKKIRELAPFELSETDKIYIQKVLARESENEYLETGIIGVKGKFFAVIVDYKQKKEGEIAHVGGLRSLEEVESDAREFKSKIQCYHDGRRFVEQVVDESLGTIFKQIRNDLKSDDGSWKEWLHDISRVSSPTPPRHSKLRTWYRLICIMPHKSHLNANKTNKYFSVLLDITDGMHTTIVRPNKKFALYESPQEAEKSFLRFCKPYHNAALANSKMLVEVC